MIIHGLTFPDASKATNFTLDSGATFPAASQHGEMFALTAQSEQNYPGVFYYHANQAVWKPMTGSYDIAASSIGKPLGGAVMARLLASRIMFFPTNLIQSVAIVGTVPNAETIFSIRKNNVQFGTLTFAANSASGIFVSTATSFDPGDLFTVENQAVSDPDLANLTFTLVVSV